MYFTKKLKDVFGTAKASIPSSKSDKTNMSEESLRRVPGIRSRKWIDDHENEFIFGLNKSSKADADSDAAASGDSWKNINTDVDVTFGRIEGVCHSDVASSAVATKFTTSQIPLLKELMVATFDGWKSVRHRSAIKTRLRSQFQTVKRGRRLQNTVITALTFLSRVYLGVSTFIDAAEKITKFQSIEFVKVRVPPPQLRHKPSQGSPLEVTKQLGIEVVGAGWINHLQKRKTKDLFHELRKHTRHIHAELQVLHHHDTFYALRNESYDVHSYIGCSKRCCFLCYCFILAHGGFRIRGTHETIMPRWEVPGPFPDISLSSEFQSATGKLLYIITSILRNSFQQCYSTADGELLAQSSAAMSTAQTVLDRELEKMERPVLNARYIAIYYLLVSCTMYANGFKRQMMMMPVVDGESILITPLPEKPGFAYVIGDNLGEGREMPLEEAEIYKENHIRMCVGLERQDEMPPRQEQTKKMCKSCKKPANLRCSACRMTYCSKACQRKDWKWHVFICAVGNRPNDFDRLRRFLVQGLHIKADESARSRSLVELFSDDHLCRAFGFVNCFDHTEVLNLLCILGFMTQIFRSCINKLDMTNLGQFMESWCRTNQAQDKDDSLKCHCVQWFLTQRATGFDIPNWDGEYIYQVASMGETIRAFSLHPPAADRTPLSSTEKKIFALYFHLFRPFNNIPDACSSEWIKFGFCFCKNNDQKKSLANAYLELAKTGVSLNEVARARDTSSLPQLMEAQGIDLSFLYSNDIGFQQPDVDEFGIYQLIAEVSHTLSGRFCHCFRPAGCCHSKYETHLSLESDIDYGFHGASAWERWQLLNFYRYIFRHPNFDARKMQVTRRSPDTESLERYLDSLVPNFRMKIGNKYLADAMFPKLKTRANFPKGRPDCYCVVHRMMGSEGLDRIALCQIRSYLAQEVGEDDEEDNLGNCG